MSRNRCLPAIYIAVCLCIAGVSGCSNDSENVVLAEDGHTAQEKVLRFFAPMDAGSSALYYRELIDQYNRLNKGVRVVYEGISTGDGYNEYLEQRLDAGEGDDVFIVNADMVKTLYHKGYFYDMSEFSAFQQLNESTKEQAMIKDTAYCLPVSMTAYCLFVNLDVLNQYNLQTPQNLEEFRNCCSTIKAAGGTPLSLNRWYALTVPALANGLSKIYGAENLQDIRSNLNSGELKIGDYMQDGFEVVEEFIQEGWYGDGLNAASVETMKAGDQDLPDFVSGKTAFYFGHLDSLSAAEEINPDINCVVQGVPVTDGTVTLPAALTRLSINADSKNLAETVDFVNYITSNKYKEVSSSGNGVLPIYVDAEYTLQNEKMRPAYETFIKGGQVPIEDMQLQFTYWDTVRELSIKMFDGYTAGEAAEEYDRIQIEQIAQYDN
ncbi:extracellular solute-binding protein [Ruminococcus sp. OA3]|uniref:ABC transporter substrate-binding protein n=1 Tax=Ruminococcus sp. OA3 TaxID=2914164 RepID=UPI001F05E7D4|nr:extracellular solute-binding protein [Ruminococcus sp. OA3]MCH1983002.1 extracellular solute-binding protein [Ruminococcus sp. OA3]